MNTRPPEAHPPRANRWIFLVVAIVLTGLGLEGVFGNDLGYTNALFEPDYTISYVPADGPLAEAGFLAGDSVVSVEGIPVVELGMYSRWPHSLSRRPGESITMVVDRAGELVSGEVIYRQLPASSKKLQAGALVVLLAFLWAGVWALFSVQASRAIPHAKRLAFMGLAAGLSVQVPYAGSWNGLVEHVHMAAMVLWVLLLFRFFLFFPRPKKMALSHLTTLVIYLPWVALIVCLVVELVFHPRFYHSFGAFMGLLLFSFLILAVASFVHGWVKTPREEMGPSGMRPVLLGMAIGFGGILLWLGDEFLLQGFDIPGTAWAPVLMGVVPVGLALGVRRAALRE